MRPLLTTALAATVVWGAYGPSASAQEGVELLPERRAARSQSAPGPGIPRAPATQPSGEFFMQEVDHNPLAIPDSEVVSGDPGVRRDRLYFGEQNGAQWVRGTTYKASLAADGFAYVPFLGSAAPRSYPVAFRLRSAQLGAEALGLSKSAEVVRNGTQFVLHRGAVDVIYDFKLESVEQSFLLDVAGSTEDLTLTLDVETELLAESAGQGFVFGNELGGVRYGAATVFDGAGQSASVPATLTGATLALTVPGSFLSSATGMILVDPLVDTFSVDTASGYQGDVDVAYDLTSDSFLYVYEDQFSGADVDIYMSQLGSDGSSIAAAYVEMGNDNWYDPSVATVNSADRALIAATSNGGGAVAIVGRIWDFSTQTFATGPIAISGLTPSVPQTKADVGGNSTSATGSAFMVVWNSDFGTDSDITGRRIGIGGALGSAIFLDSSTTNNSFDVSISESTGDPATVNRWNVGYINEELSSGAFSIKTAQFNALGSLVVGPVTVHTVNAGETIGELEVSDGLSLPGGAPVHAISFDLYSTPAEDTYVVFCRGGIELNTVDLHTSEHADILLNQSEARLSTTAEDFVITYLERVPGTNRHQGFMTAFDFIEGTFLAISERRVPMGVVANSSSANYLQDGGVAIASRFSGGLYASRMVAMGNATGTTPQSDIAGNTAVLSNGYSPAYQYCYGNENSTGERGFVRMSGDRTATSSKQIIASSLPPNSFGYFIVGDAFAVVNNPGGSAGVLCLGGSIGRYSNSVGSSGGVGRIERTFNPTAISQPGGAVVGMSGQFWQFSLWHRDSAGGVPTSNFTNAVSILFE